MEQKAKETKELVTWVAQILNATGKSLEDGSIGIFDMANFATALMGSVDAINGITDVPHEFKSLTEADRMELVEHFKYELDLPQDWIESKIETWLDIALRVGHEVLDFVAVRNEG